METIDVEDLTHDELLNDEGLLIVSDEENNDEIIEICDLPKDTNDAIGQFNDIYRENNDFGKFIEKCLQLDNYEGMLRVIMKTLIPLYESTSDEFKGSLVFKKCMNSAFHNLEIDPEHKFSHVKNVCETFKRFITKKKVPFVTLERNLKNKSNIADVNHKRKKRKRAYTNKTLTETNALKSNLSDANIINLVDEIEEFEVPIVNLDDPVIFISEPIEIDDDKETSDDISTLECNDKVDALADTSHNLKNNKEMDIETNTNDCEVVIDDNKQDNYLIPDKMLVPKSFEENTGVNSMLHYSPSVEEKVQSIEKEIAHYKLLVSCLEQDEVTVDSQYSPYVRCEKYKAMIVQLYKGLCRLIGEEPVKRREVRLKPANPRSQLPIKKLEEFINSNIGSDGLPHFPDFNEVLFCVNEANNEGRLGWSKKEVMAEARALFTYCGQALQQSRQRREWRDMIRLVKTEVDHDPADSDPELLAKLEENKLLAKAKETEIFEKFSNMDKNYAFNANENDDVDSEEDSDFDNEEIENNNVGMSTYNDLTTNDGNVQDNHHTTKDDTDLINERNSNPHLNNCEQSEYVSSTTQPDEQNNNQLDPESISQGDVTTTTDDCDIGLKIISVVSIANNRSNTHEETLVDRISKSDTSHIEVVGIEIDNSEDYTHCNNDAVNVSEPINKTGAVKTDESHSRLKELLCNDVNTYSTVKGVDDNHNNYNEILQGKTLLVKLEKVEDTTSLCEEIKIKEEPKSNLLNDLEELGDNFTTTILDILDPFLVIEISSDSSSDDDTDLDSDVES